MAPGREAVIGAIRQSWCAETSTHDEFSSDNPAHGQCDVSSFVAWQYLGGDLVLSKVFVDDEEVEHHYWNRIDGEDIDLTREQFRGDQRLVEIDVVTHNDLINKAGEMNPELRRRISVLGAKVARVLGEPPQKMTP